MAMQNHDEYSVDLTADVDRVPDGGRVSNVCLRYGGGPVVAGLVVQYEDDQVLVDEITINDTCMPSPTARRLLAALYRVYMPLVGEFGDSGIIVKISLPDFLRGQYEDTQERHTVEALLVATLQNPNIQERRRK
jgi:hypothetical protein